MCKLDQSVFLAILAALSAFNGALASDATTTHALHKSAIAAAPPTTTLHIHRVSHHAAGITQAIVKAASSSQAASELPAELLDQLLAAVRVNPNDLNLRRLLAAEFIKRGLTVKAAEQLKQVMNVAGENAEDLTLYADACRYSADTQTAIVSYKKALTLAPMNARAWAGLSLAYAQAGDRQTAMNTCRSGLAQISDSKGRKELSGTLNSIQNMSAPAVSPAEQHVAS
jgi:Flp pilus assembly protein TadD